MQSSHGNFRQTSAYAYGKPCRPFAKCIIPYRDLFSAFYNAIKKIRNLYFLFNSNQYIRKEFSGLDELLQFLPPLRIHLPKATARDMVYEISNICMLDT